MPINLKKLRLFVASPNDVSNERKTLEGVVNELNTTIAPDKGFVLELVRWETHCHPSMGRAQENINSQIGEYDIFLGIMWKKFGSPTGAAQSGTEEEFRIAYKAWQNSNSPWIMFYFCKTPFMPNTKQELDQFSKVLSFMKELQTKGLTWEYPDNSKFADIVRPHLARIIIDISHNNGGEKQSSQPTKPIPPTKPSKRKIFLSYGSDELSALKVREFLEIVGCEVIILKNEPMMGITIFEKFEKILSNVSLAVVILSPDDETLDNKLRARQNVIFELGMLMSKLGRNRILILSKSNIEYPSDIMGSIYINYGDDIESSFENLRRELKHQGLIN